MLVRTARVIDTVSRFARPLGQELGADATLDLLLA